MAPRKTYVYTVTTRDFESDKDKKGVFNLVSIHANVNSANSAAGDVSGDPEDDTEVTTTKDLCQTHKNKSKNFNVLVKKVELKGDGDGDGQGAGSAASSVATKKTAASAASSSTKKAPATAKKSPSAASTKKTQIEGEKDSLKGLKLLFTGTFNEMDRKTCEATAEAHGAEILGPTKMDQTDFVVLGTRAGQKKLDEINEKGLETITEAQFIEKLGQPPTKKRKA